VHQPKRLADAIDAGDDSDHDGDKGGAASWLVSFKP